MALLVTSSNVFTKEVRAEVAKDSNLYKIVQEKVGLDLGSEEKIVQKAKKDKPKQKNYINTNGLVIANIPEIAEKQDTQDNIMLFNQGGTLTATNVLGKEVSKKRGEVVEYEVQEGESLGIIAGKFGLSLNTLLWANNLKADDFIKPGQNVKIPPDSGFLYVVKSGDTLDDILEKHKADKEETLKINEEVIDENENIVVGTEILLADGSPYVAPTPKPTYSSTPASNTRLGSIGNLFVSGNDSNVTGGTLNWPSACRRISQGVRWGHVAIDINCGYGNPIRAAESGTVSIQQGGGYGNYIIIRHSNGLTTLYAHLSAYSVQNGQYVSRGQQIGVEGSTGWSTGPHLHFEVTNGGVKQNPWNYL